ncbi:IS6 family transposase [Dietzia sp. ANT_WB102]|uniref:IS6 family transposase n=1 Tax=Dietzia sp. ANT_WB102 TaxID=2597345 RepID=UPI00165D3A7F|nr:IS6 family transposase [Dietzia sp. ANT_WB102]
MVLPLRHLLQGARGDAYFSAAWPWTTRRSSGGSRSTGLSWIHRPAGTDASPRWGADSWRVDETYIRIGGKWCYLYRAVTKRGDTLDFYLSTRRSTASAKRFLAKTLRSTRHHGQPRVICTDKNPALAAAITALKAEGKCHQKWNIAGQSTATTSSEATTVDWKRILGPKSGFKTPTSAYRALQGMEAMHSLRKGQGRLFAYDAPNPDAVIVTKAFQHL